MLTVLLPEMPREGPVRLRDQLDARPNVTITIVFVLVIIDLVGNLQ